MLNFIKSMLIFTQVEVVVEVEVELGNRNRMPGFLQRKNSEFIHDHR